MIKRLFISLYFVIHAFFAFSQKYGNEWIDYNQRYFKVSIPNTGLYRIGYDVLQNSGIPLNSINPKNFQLFIRGEEQHVFIDGEADDRFDMTDYIEFYAKKNDGMFDSLVYENINRLPNPYIPLFNDTNYAYLTWNSSLNNKRVGVENDLNFAGYTPTDYVYTEKVKAYNTHYSSGPTFIDVISDPRYVQTEGFGEYINKGQLLQTDFGNLNVYSSASLPVKIRVSYSGASSTNVGGINYDHQLKVDFLDQSGQYKVLNDTTFLGFKHFIIEKELISQQIQNNTLIRVISESNPLITKNNITNVHYIYLRYPQIPDLLNKSEHTFYLENNPTQLKTFLEIKNMNTSGAQVILYDLNNHKYILTSSVSNTVRALVPNGNFIKHCFLTTTNNIKQVQALVPVNETGFFKEYKSQANVAPYLIITHKNLKNSASNYQAYRESFQGGSHQVIMANIDDLYDQFVYGNVKNPLAIKNLCRYLSDNLSVSPKYLLLIGKSIKHSLIKNNPTNWMDCLIPTMGNPPSDNLLTSGIGGVRSSVPSIPVGRISAKNDAEVTSYLNKVKIHEASLIETPIKDWHKRVLHFSGGSDLSQQQTFANYLNDFGNIIKDTLFGAKIFNFGKTTTAPIQTNVSDSIKQLIEYGASLITFFGHGSVTGFDQAIDDPTLYNNEGRYPLFLANSCYSGDIHLPGASSTSENFTLIDKKGSIGFVASSSYGLINTLYNYSKGIYKSLSKQSYFSGIGDAVRNSCIYSSSDQLQEITNLEMTLEGDPSIKLNGFEKPDYEITNSSIYFNTSTYVDSIGVNIIIKNNAKAIHDTFIVKVEHLFPSGDSALYYKQLKAPFNIDTVHLFIAKDVTKHIGLNRFRVEVDALSEVNELSEINNTTRGYIDLIIPGGDVIPVFPHKYAIVPFANQITLKASTIDPFAPDINYKLQLDTSDAFTNPIQSVVINCKGGVIKWTVNLPFKDSTVYFWRISKDSILATDKYAWRESSFQVMGNQTGWSQAHFHQFKNDRYQYVNYIKNKRAFEFFNNKIGISCNNEYKSSNLYGIRYTLNNTIRSNYNFNTNNGWSIAVFDSVSTEPWTSSVSNGYSFAQPYNNCLAFPNEKRASFDFGPATFCGTNANWKNDLQNFLNAVPVNNYVLAYSSNTHHSSTFNSALYDQFESFGGYSLRTVGDSVPLIIFGKKRSNPYVGCGQEVIGTSVSSKILLTDTLITKWNQGFIESEIIGPTSKWHSLHWNFVSQNNNSGDDLKLKIIGIKHNGTEDTLAYFSKNELDIYNLNNTIDATIYPRAKLVVYISDNKFHKAPQLKKWQVIYEPIPECAINPQSYYVNNSSLNTINEGDDLMIHLPIENIGMLDFKDSIEISYIVEDANRVKHQIPLKLISGKFGSNNFKTDTFRFNTIHFSGLNHLWVNVNSPSSSKYQLEQFHFNNVAQIPFFVSKDKINPLLDVTVDGVHILNGDIVSSKPKIMITLKDENKFLSLNDTSAFTISVKYPNQSTLKRLNFKEDLNFLPAQLPDNLCKVEWHPNLFNDGKYTLNVKANDRSKNASGAEDYSIQFEVLNKQTITQVFNYPNPFSTSTKFVFTLTGSELPDVFTIQIMTITGKVVREITKDELGAIHIGRNITDYAWDGKDEFGEKLANGVYLYKIIVRNNGKALESRSSDGDDFFKKGYGKMVIIR